jgi:hypothetical protein
MHLTSVLREVLFLANHPHFRQHYLARSLGISQIPHLPWTQTTKPATKNK